LGINPARRFMVFANRLALSDPNAAPKTIIAIYPIMGSGSYFGKTIVAMKLATHTASATEPAVMMNQRGNI
jgi:hypothetical protein